MGSIKGTNINVQFATVDSMSKQLQDAHSSSGSFLDNVSAAARGLAATAKKYDEVAREALVTVQKAKDIGADSVVKEASGIADAAKRNAALCISRQSKLEAVIQMR